MQSKFWNYSFLKEELPLVFLITFLLLLLSVPLVFGNHFHKEPSCNCCVSNETSATSEDDTEVDDDKEQNSYKLLKKYKKRAPSVSRKKRGKKSTSRKLLKKKSKKRRKSTKKVAEKEEPLTTEEESSISSSSSSTTKKEEEDRVKVKLELEPKDGDDGKVDFNLDVAVDPDTPGKEQLTTHLEGQVHLCSFQFVE